MEPAFTLSAQPGTDIWKKPPTTDIFTAPSRPHTIAPLPNFRSATLTFSAAYTRRFDQAGLLLVLTHPPSGARKWIKAGVEFFNDRPRLSTVCCDNFADWSVAPLFPTAAEEAAVTAGKEAVTVTVRREEDENGVGLWVYHLHGDEKVPMREIAWVYPEGGEGWELEVSALVARPAKEASETLEATFKDFNVQWEKP